MAAKSGLIEIVLSSAVNDSIYDALILVSSGIGALRSCEKLKHLADHVEEYAKVHKSLETARSTLVLHPELPSKRLVYCGTGPVHRDFDDVRRYLEAGKAGISAALSAGAKSPLLAVVPSERFRNAELVAALGVLHNLYVPLNVRSEEPERATKIDRLGILKLSAENTGRFLRSLDALQSAFVVCRDVGDGDPIRMAPPRAADYVAEHFKGSAVSVRVESGVEELREKYPLLAAVNRAANNVDEHKARVVWLEYENKEKGDAGDEFETLMLVGKGVTLDTGGADVKVGGAMQGMSRDKYGSAVVAGFFEALDKLRPKNLKVRGVMCLVRNSIGSNSYTTDEIITSRSGKRILICNTDAEGRLAMLDPLTRCREEALSEQNPHLYTIATLTGHEVLSYGLHPAVMDNGPARAAEHARRLQAVGDDFGQPVEISRWHIEDFDFNDAPMPSVDLRQGGNRASVQTIRGHQSPGAFLMRGSRLDEHGTESKHPIKYSHMDIGSAMGDYPGVSYPSPLLALVAHHLLPRAE
ncbi:CYTOSOL-AP domain-containing protein [Aphelenchoides fujianensis]|nr:CYTOSOL-AP domain-containing protein [Aphelenchoides fujianensis]